MATVKAILTKPLDGAPEGSEREFEQADFDQLSAYGAVRKVEDAPAKAVLTPANKMAPAPANKGAVRG